MQISRNMAILALAAAFLLGIAVTTVFHLYRHNAGHVWFLRTMDMEPLVISINGTNKIFKPMCVSKNRPQSTNSKKGECDSNIVYIESTSMSNIQLTDSHHIHRINLNTYDDPIDIQLGIVAPD